MKISRKHLVGVSALTLSFTAFAAQAQIHEQITVCRTAAGVFGQARFEDGSEVGICRIGATVIGSTDLVSFMDTQSGMAISFDNYKRGVRSCAIADGREDQIVNLENHQNVSICRFKDGSLMDMATLQAGKKDPRNIHLNHLLGVR